VQCSLQVLFAVRLNLSLKFSNNTVIIHHHLSSLCFNCPVFFFMFNPNRESIASFASDIGKCQTILKVVHKEMIKIQEELQMGRQRSTADKTLHRYY